MWSLVLVSELVSTNVLLQPLRPELDGWPLSANYSDLSTKL
jgi:hypothetical protein